MIFKNFQVDVKDIKCLFQWWEKWEFMFFSKVGFFARKILGTMNSQIKIERIFSLT